MVKRGMTIAAAVLMTVQPVVAVAAPTSNGIASNRAALGMPVAAERTCTTVGGRASCTTTDANKIGSESVLVLIAALAAVTAGIVVIAQEKTSPNSP